MNISPMSALQRANRGDERLWKIWWQWGIPLGMLATALSLLAEASRVAGHLLGGDAVDFLKLLLIIGWFRLVWRCSKNADRPIWGNLAKLAILLGIGVAALTV